MKKADMLQDIKEQLGFPTVSVYTEDSVIEHCMQRSFNLLSSKVFYETSITVPCNPAVKLDNTVVCLITDVKPLYQDIAKEVYDKSPFAILESMYTTGIPTGDILTPTLSVMLHNQIKAATGNKFGWRYERASGWLYVSNIPAGSRSLSLNIKTPHTWETLSEDLMQWIFDHSLAQVKIIEGRIRSKFKEGATAVVSDGETLLNEGNTEKTALEEKLESFIPLNIGTRR